MPTARSVNVTLCALSDVGILVGELKLILHLRRYHRVYSIVLVLVGLLARVLWIENVHAVRQLLWGLQKLRVVGLFDEIHSGLPVLRGPRWVLSERGLIRLRVQNVLVCVVRAVIFTIVH